MSVLFLIICVLAIWHLIYDGIIAPAFRLHLRNNLFKLRDELRNLKIQGLVPDADQKVFDLTHSGINSFLNRLPNLTMSAQYDAHKAIQNDSKLYKEIQNRLALLAETSNKELKSIFERTASVVATTLIVNSGAWLIYIVPLFILLGCIKTLRKYINEILVVPSYNSDRVLPKIRDSAAIA